jgi:hypothetical protein
LPHTGSLLDTEVLKNLEELKGPLAPIVPVRELRTSSSFHCRRQSPFPQVSCGFREGGRVIGDVNFSGSQPPDGRQISRHHR